MKPWSDVEWQARGLESAIFAALNNAHIDPARESYWREYADRMERKFTTQHGRHYSDFISR